MKKETFVYPVIIRKTEDEEEVPYFVKLPDFESATQGVDLADALFMAQDLLCCRILDYEDEGRELPTASNVDALEREAGDIVTLVAADMNEYRKSIDMTAVRKNVSLPAWMSYEAEKAGLSLSAVLQEGLKRELNIAG